MVIGGGRHVLEVGVQGTGELRINLVKGYVRSIFLKDLSWASCEVPIVDRFRLDNYSFGNLELKWSRFEPQIIEQPFDLRLKGRSCLF